MEAPLLPAPLPLFDFHTGGLVFGILGGSLSYKFTYETAPQASISLATICLPKANCTIGDRSIYGIIYYTGLGYWVV